MEEECEVDVESAEEVPDIGGEATTSTYDEGFHDSYSQEDGGAVVKNDKREHHNLLERRRRDHIKESFYGLRDCIPQLKGEKVSRAHILNKATDYIRTMQKCGSTRKGEIEGLKLRNEILEEQIKALERHKAGGSDTTADEILESVREQVTAKHKEDQQQKTNKKTTTIVGEKAENIVQSLAASKSIVPPAKKPAAPKPATPSGSSESPGNQAITLLASNLKNTQTLLAALQKSLPPNSSLPANIKSLAQRVLASPQARQQLQATATNALRGIVTATTVTSNTPPKTAKATPSNDQKTSSKQETQELSAKATPTEPSVELATPSSSTGNMSPQQILNTAHLLLQQQGAESADKQNISPEVLSQVSSYLNLPAALDREQESSEEMPNSFLTAALTTVPTHNITAANTSGVEEVIEPLTKKPRLDTL